MDWKQETILTLITIPIVSSVICGISEVIEDKLKSLPYEYHNSFEYQRTIAADSIGKPCKGEALHRGAKATHGHE